MVFSFVLIGVNCNKQILLENEIDENCQGISEEQMVILHSSGTSDRVSKN